LLVAQLNKDISAALNDASVQLRIRTLGLVPAPSTPEEFTEQIHRDYQSTARLVKLAGIEKQ
jgi:tripartite-type tricarboxylate transporter receptor subunit TctC